MGYVVSTVISISAVALVESINSGGQQIARGTVGYVVRVGSANC